MPYIQYPILNWSFHEGPNETGIKKWDAQYRDKVLAIIGVRTPDLDYESNVDNLRREVAGLGINYPVVTDNDYSTWKAYKVEAWPTLFLLDKQQSYQNASPSIPSISSLTAAVNLTNALR